MKKKFFVLFVAILVLAFSLLSFSACTTINDFKDDVVSIVNDYVAIDDAGNGLEDGKTYDMPKALKFYAASPNSSKTVRLTASITPASATDKTVDWSVAWNNPSSTWATGKTVTDYVTVTPTSDGSLTADVHFVANFGEQIIVSVVSRVNSYASVACSVDCFQDVSALSTLDLGGHSWYCNFVTGSPSFPSSSYFETSSNALYVHDTYGSGNASPCSAQVASSSSPYTVNATVSSFRLYCKRSEALGTALANVFYNETGPRDLFAATMQYTEITSSSYDAHNSSYPSANVISAVDFFEVLFSDYLCKGNVYLYQGQYYNKILEALQNTSGTQFSVKAVVTYVDIGDVSYEYDLRFSDASLNLVAASISVSQSSITF